jgi:hypothetical protein
MTKPGNKTNAHCCAFIIRASPRKHEPETRGTTFSFYAASSLIRHSSFGFRHSKVSIRG